MSECQASTSAQHQCDTCHKTFSKERYLRRHCRLVHVEDPRATCQFCNKQFCKSNLKRHDDLVHREIKTYTRVMIAKLNMVQKSSLTATSVKNIICPNFIVITVTNHSHISATYDSITKFVRVTRENQKQKQFKCTKCRKIFMSGRYMYLRAHVKNIHEEGQKAICDTYITFHFIANNVLYACGCQAALLYHIELGNHYTCKFLFLYAQGRRASLDWIYKSVCYRTGMLPLDPLRGPVCNAAASSVL